MDTNALHIKIFPFNPFQENTYLLYNDEGQAVIIDPGCYSTGERQQLSNFVKEKALKVEGIWLTHAHIDHVLGLQFAVNEFAVPVYAHELSREEISYALQWGHVYGTPLYECPYADKLIGEGSRLKLGDREFEVFHAPGHSPGSLVFYSQTDGIAIVGDVIFRQAIGRWDLPYGNYQVLMQSIVEKVMTLPPDTRLYPGHGTHTTVGFEEANNPYVKGHRVGQTFE